MKELRVLFDDNLGLYIAWEKSVIANKYVILGKDDTFNDVILKEVTDNIIYLEKNELEGIVAISVEYVVTDDLTKKDVTIDRTNSYVRRINAYKFILPSCIRSYKGLSLSYATNNIYDRYFIYEKVNDKYEKILETEDFQITTNKIKEGKTYYIEAYTKNESGVYELKGKSQDFICTPTEFVYNSKEPCVSIIIPAYNIARLLPRTLDSIVFSTLNNIEVILLNDGSKDNTLEVMNWYKNKYPGLITVVDKENEGQAKTRFLGLNYAHAKYTYFMDADDMVHPNMLSRMYDSISKEDADFVMNKIIARTDFDQYSIFFDHIDDHHNENRYIVKNYYDYIMNKHNGSYENFYLVTLWHQMGKTDLYRAHPMPHFNNYEDIAYVRVISSFADKFVFDMDAYYVWDRRVGVHLGSSSTRSEKYDSAEKKIEMYVDAVFYFVNDLSEERIEVLYYDALKDVAGYIEPTIDAFNSGNPYNRDNLYIEYTYKYLKMHDVLNMQMIRQDERIYKIAEGVVMLVENNY